jgi:uncharacterized protein YbjQ (UPF0145 family)
MGPISVVLCFPWSWRQSTGRAFLALVLKLALEAKELEANALVGLEVVVDPFGFTDDGEPAVNWRATATAAELRPL